MKKIYLNYSKKLFILTLSSILLYFFSCRSEQKADMQKNHAQSQSIISGKVHISKSLEKNIDSLSIMFIIARSPEGGIVAVKKLIPPFAFPVEFSLTNEDLMISGTEIPKYLNLSARLDKDGNANRIEKGDIINQSPLLKVPQRSSEINITLDKLVK